MNSFDLINCLTWPPSLLFRRGSSNEDIVAKEEIGYLKDETGKIRCPLCRWTPDRTSRWMCSDSEYPENFSGGCGAQWNTFDTNGVCPACSHQWIWTSCLSCHKWSKHQDWYEGEESR